MKNPFRGLRFSLLDFHNARAGVGMKIAFAAICCIPLIYGALYLAAFYDPYGNIDKVPVVVVNKDKGYEVDGERLEVGDTVVEQLRDSDALDFTYDNDEQSAREGLEKGTYYMELVIPEDFSENVASASTDNPKQADFELIGNQSANSIATTMGTSAFRVITSKVNYAIGQDYYVTIFDTIDDSAASIKVAADGSAELADGLVTAEDGSQKITDNLLTAGTGADELAAGLVSAVSGSQTLTNGIQSAQTGAQQLSAGTVAAASGSQKITDGLGDADTGAGELSSGLQTLSDGAAATDDGAQELAGGLGELSGGAATLQAAIEGQQGSIAQLNGGAGQVYQGLDTLYNSLPALLSAALSGQSITTSSVDEGAIAGVGESLDGAQAAVDDLSGHIADAQAHLNATANEDGSYTLSAEDYEALVAALNGADASSASGAIDAARTSAQGIEATETTITAQEDLSAASASTQQLMATIAALRDGAQQVYGGTQALQTQFTEYQAADGSATLLGGAAALAQGAAQTKQGADQLAGGTAQVAAGATSAQQGAASLSSGISTLKAGSATLTSGLTDAETGAAALSAGLDQLHVGAGTLTGGLDTATTGATALAEGLGLLYDGSSTLTSGLATAHDGANELADGLKDGYETALESTENSDLKAEVMSEPVALESEDYTTVNNYGSGFAPYFIALGLWVGALMTTFIIKPLNQRLVASGANPVIAAFSGLVPAMLVGTIQAVLMALVLQFGLKIDLLHPAAYYALCILTALCFAAWNQMLVVGLGFPGKFLSVVLLMLQLTSAAGTFPIEVVPGFFKAINPFLPMTYSVRALRVATTGLDMSMIAPNVAMLIVFAAVPFVITCLIAARKRLVTLSDLHPLVQL